MISIIYLVAPHIVEREQRTEAPELIDRDGVVFSLRGGPRQPKPTDRDWDSVAVYAPDELSEETSLRESCMARRSCSSSSTGKGGGTGRGTLGTNAGYRSRGRSLEESL